MSASPMQALLEAGHEPEVIKVGGLGVGPRFLQWTTAGRRKVEEVSGQKVVPVLVTDDGEVLVESARIVEWTEANPATGHPGDPPSQSPLQTGGSALGRMRQMWTRLPAAHRRWIFVKALLATAVFNLILNEATAWIGVQGQDEVQLWGAPLVETSIFWNMLGTLFLLPLITCVLVTTAIRRDIIVGSLSSLSWLRGIYPPLSALPSGRLRRGVTLGALAVIVLAPPLAIGLAIGGVAEVTTQQFVICQTVFAVALGALVTPVIALVAMADPYEPRGNAGASNLGSAKRRGWDSNPRAPCDGQQFSRLPRSTTPAPLRDSVRR